MGQRSQFFKLLNMEEDYSQRIFSIASPICPVEKSTVVDWVAFEDKIGFTFPADYKSLINLLGTGWFGSSLNFRNPVASRPHLRLCRDQLIEYKIMMSDVAQDSNVRLYPDDGGMIMLGHMDHHEFLLRPKNQRILCDFVWWDTDAERTTDLNMSVTQFVHDLYLGLIGESWAEQMRKFFWENGRFPLFEPVHL